jgi:hypothetical protein
LIMSQQAMTRWIEDADARQFSEAARLERTGITERHYMHFGEAVASLPSWLRHGVSCESLAAIGCHALAHLRHVHDHQVL